MRKFIILFLLLIIFSCTKDENSKVKTSVEMSEEAEQYLNTVLDIMEENSINRYKINWEDFRARTIMNAGSAQTTYQTYSAIRNAIVMLGDGHSFLIEPSYSTSKNTGSKTNTSNRKGISDIYGVRLKDNIAYIVVPAFSGYLTESLEYANKMHSVIKVIDAISVKAWVVDLRNNTGGNMWPMIAGIGPILGNGLAGKFIDPDYYVSNWSYNNGESMFDDNTVLKVENYYTLINENPYVAVLTNSSTSSSGEATTISFIGRAKTRSFGEPTDGRSTSNKTFLLRDGAKLALTVATMADRAGNLFGKEITPDEVIPSLNRPNTYDDVVKNAVQWIESNL